MMAPSPGRTSSCSEWRDRALQSGLGVRGRATPPPHRLPGAAGDSGPSSAPGAPGARPSMRTAGSRAFNAATRARESVPDCALREMFDERIRVRVLEDDDDVAERRGPAREVHAAHERRLFVQREAHDEASAAADEHVPRRVPDLLVPHELPKPIEIGPFPHNPLRAPRAPD